MDPLTRDQEFFAARLAADSYFEDITVLEQRKGVTDSDIETALSVLNTTGGKVGACVIVLMPELRPSEPDSPGPSYTVRAAMQVITSPIFNDGADGTGKSSEAIAERVRQLCHRFNNGTGTWSFAGMEPLEVQPGQVSYAVSIERLALDADLPRQPLPMIDPEEAAAPQTLTITAAEGAQVYYTTDGSYPWSGNDAATLYSAPFEVGAAATVLAVAHKTGFQASNVAEAIIT